MRTIPAHTLEFIDSWLELRYKWAEIPGFVVAIAKKGELVFNKAYGYANIETSEKLTPDHVLRIASHSKTFTATALLQLQEQGKLRVDDLVVEYLPWLREHKDVRWQTVTIRQLLSHSAGVIRDGDDSDYWQLARPFPNEEQLITAILDTELVKDPNTKLKYSNYGYGLLGLIIEEASGVTYGEYVHQHIISSLQLERTSADVDEKLLYATGYSRLTVARTRHALPNPSTSALASATGFSSTASDLARYFSAQIIGTGKLLSDESKREVQRVQWEVENARLQTWYGLGFEHEQYGKRKLLGHGGGFPGYITQSVFSPKDELVVIVLTNAQDGPATAISRGVVEILDELGDNPPANELRRYEGRFVTLWGVYDIVATHEGLIGLYANNWSPISNKEKLHVVDGSTLRIEKTSGFFSEGELIRYTFKEDGSVDYIVNSGSYSKASDDGDVPQTWI